MIRRAQGLGTHRKNRSQSFCPAGTFRQHGGRVYGKRCRPLDTTKVWRGGLSATELIKNGEMKTEEVG